jgi:hypothetical protein
MDLSVLVIVLVFTGLALWLSLVGKKWSAIISYTFFGGLLGLGLFGAFELLSKAPAGPSHQFGVAYLLLAAISASMILVTNFVYRYRQRLRAP